MIGRVGSPVFWIDIHFQHQADCARRALLDDENIADGTARLLAIRTHIGGKSSLRAFQCDEDPDISAIGPLEVRGEFAGN